MRGKVGVNGLRKHYGAKQRRGTKREHNRTAAGKVIRYSLQQLSQMGLVGDLKFEDSDQINGKVLTKKGYTDMDRIAQGIAKQNKKK
jgi:small subunit ribosomal protein S19e